jgi:DNA primase
MHAARGVGHCFGCGESWNVITLVEKLQGVGRHEAKMYLAAEHGAQFRKRRRAYEPDNPFSPAQRRWRGQAVAGRKPGSDRLNLIYRKRLVQEAAVGQSPLELRKWVESKFGVKKNYANKLLRQLRDEGRLFVEDGRCYGSVDAARERDPSPYIPSLKKQMTHPGGKGFPADPFAVQDPARRDRIRRRQELNERLRRLE